MLVGEAIARIRGNIKETTVDSYIPNRLIWSWIYTALLKYLEREKYKLHNLDIFTTESFDAERVNLLEDSCVPLDCTVSRIKVSMLETKNGPIYKYITSPDRSQQFRLTTARGFERKIRTKGRSEYYAFKEGDYIYLEKYLPCVLVSYLNIDLTSSKECSKLEELIPIPDYIMDTILKEALQEASIAIQKPQDIVQNKNTGS